MNSALSSAPTIVVNDTYWRRSLIAIFVSFVLLFVLYFTTFYSMVEIWMRSETFAHGFFIFPISIWLIWRKSGLLAAYRPVVFPFASLLMIPTGLFWLLGDFMGILVLQQLAFIAMIIVLVLSILGWQVTRQLMFPLLFLFFSVPMGEELIPVLIDFTADFTVTLVQFTGIPVYREGSFFQLPTGSWSVVKACSGVRYLIASMTLGCLYAYINYRSNLRRTVFIVVSIIVPIIANGLRAYMIVMIGHYSGMELATGVDHLVYGWMFFGLVIVVMFYIGSFWREDGEKSESDIRMVKEETGRKSISNFGLQRNKLFFVFSLIIIWPLISFLSKDNTTYALPQANLIPQLPQWKMVSSPVTGWQPLYHNLSQQEVSVFDKNLNRVQVFMGFYATQKQDHELVNYLNRLSGGEDTHWRIKDKSSLPIVLETKINIPVVTLFSDTEYLRVAYIYYVNHQYVSGKLNTKFLEAKARITGNLTSGTVIVMAVNYRLYEDKSDDVLKFFLEENATYFKKSIESIQTNMIIK